MNRDSVGFYLRVLVAALAPIILYWSELNLVLKEAVYNELSSHIIIIPFLTLYIIYRERNFLRAQINHSDDSITLDSTQKITDLAIGVILSISAYLIKLYGTTTFYSLEFRIASLPVFIAGVVLVIYNRGTLRALSFPILLLLFLVPPPIRVAQSIGAYLASKSAFYSFMVVKTIGLPVTLNLEYGAPIIYLTIKSGQVIPFAIDIGCSGIYSLIGFAIFAVFLSYISRGKMVNKFLVLLLGVPLIYLMNVLRVTILLIVGYFTGVETALNVFHVLGGWVLTLIGTFLLLVAAERLLNVDMFRVTGGECSHEITSEFQCLGCGMIIDSEYSDLTGVKLGKILLVLVLSISLSFVRIPVLTLSTSTSDISVEDYSTLDAPRSLLPEIENYDLRFVYRDRAFENISKQDASMMFQYRPFDYTENPVWTGVEIAATKAACHPWEACLITYAGEDQATQIDLRDIKLSEDPPVTARYFAFIEKGSDRIQVVLYWYTLSTFKTDIGYEDKWVKLSIIDYANSELEVPFVEANLRPFADEIYAYWKPSTTWSYTILTIAQNAVLLIEMLVLVSLALIGFNLIRWIQQRTQNVHLYQQVREQDREIFEVLRTQRGLCAHDLLTIYTERTEQEITPELLYSKLSNAEKLGIIKSRVTKKDDQPYLIWGLNFVPDI